MYFALDEKNAALLGIVDELYEVYQGIEVACKMWLTEYLNSFTWPPVEENQHATESNSVERIIRASLLKFLRPHSYLFSDVYEFRYLNTQQVKVYSFIEVNRIGLTLKYRIKSFGEFIPIVESIACMRLHSGLLKEKPDAMLGKVIAETNARILKKVNQAEDMAFQKQLISEMPAPDTLIVFRSLSSVSCIRSEHFVETTNWKMPLIDGSGYILLPVHRCNTCGRLFVGEKTLEVFEQLYGKMHVRLERISNERVDFDSFTESALHRAGYNVRANGLSEKERQELLLSLMKRKILYPLEIIRDIENAIRLFEYRPGFESAVAKWKSDLEFVASNKGISMNKKNKGNA